MQASNQFLNATADWTELASTAIVFGVSYLYADQNNKENKALLERMAQLDAQQEEKLKKELDKSLTDIAKTQVIIQFLNNENIKQIKDDTKQKRIIPLVGLGLGVVLLGLIFYKLNKQNG